MAKNKPDRPDKENYALESNMLSRSKTKNSFIQNPDHNNQVRREALGRNTER